MWSKVACLGHLGGASNFVVHDLDMAYLGDRIERTPLCDYGGAVSSDRSPRSLIHQVESSPVPLKVLEAIHELRMYLDAVESTTLCDARDAGASITHIAEALGTTRQTVYNRLKQLAEEQRAREAEELIIIPDLESETEQ